MQFELAQAEHGMGGAVLSVQRDYFLKIVSGFCVMVAIVFDRGEGPPSVEPCGSQCQSFSVERGGFVETTLVAGFCGLFCEGSESRGIGLTPLRIGSQARRDDGA